MYKAILHLVFLILIIFLLAWVLYESSSFLGFTVTWQYIKISQEKTVGLMALVVFGLFSLYLSAAFYNDGVFKYRTSEISGIIGVTLGFVSLSLMILLPFFSWLLLISGMLCLYSALTPFINEINKRMNNWEKGSITAILAFLVLFYLNYKSNILINEVFFVDPKHFAFTRIISAFIVASPLLFLISIFTLVTIAIMLSLKKNRIENNNFTLICSILAALTTFLFSFPLINNGKHIIENVASVVDFNSKSICLNVKGNAGVIYLDDRYNLILTDNVNNKMHNYKIEICQRNN